MKTIVPIAVNTSLPEQGRNECSKGRKALKKVGNCSSHASATAACEQSRPKQGEGKDQASDTYEWLSCTWKLALYGRFVWRGVNIDDVTIHPLRGSRINPALKVCEHNRVAHASEPLLLSILVASYGHIETGRYSTQVSFCSFGFCGIVLAPVMLESQ